MELHFNFHVGKKLYFYLLERVTVLKSLISPVKNQITGSVFKVNPYWLYACVESTDFSLFSCFCVLKLPLKREISNTYHSSYKKLNWFKQMVQMHQIYLVSYFLGSQNFSFY